MRQRRKTFLKFHFHISQLRDLLLAYLFCFVFIYLEGNITNRSNNFDAAHPVSVRFVDKK